MGEDLHNHWKCALAETTDLKNLMGGEFRKV